MKKKDIVLTILIVIIGLLSISLFTRNKRTNENKTNKIPPQKEVIRYIDKNKTEHIQKEIVPTQEINHSVTTNYNTYVEDTLAPALKIATDKIKELTQIKAKLEGELEATKIELDQNKMKRIYFENKYLSIVTTEDSTGKANLKYKYNAELNVVSYVKRKNIFSRERNYIDISSPDKNLKINGLEVYRKEIFVKPKSLGIGFQVGYGMDKNFNLAPYFGVGLSYNFINF